MARERALSQWICTGRQGCGVQARQRGWTQRGGGRAADRAGMRADLHELRTSRVSLSSKAARVARRRPAAHRRRRALPSLVVTRLQPARAAPDAAIATTEFRCGAATGSSQGRKFPIRELKNRTVCRSGGSARCLLRSIAEQFTTVARRDHRTRHRQCAGVTLSRCHAPEIPSSMPARRAD